MKHSKLNIAVLSVCLTMGAAVFAETMNKAEFGLAKDKISASYKANKALCASLSGNAKDICTEEAKANEKIARAELDESNQPSTKAHFQTLTAKAEANYAVAKEKCDDLAGNAKDVCVREAKAAEVAAKADATAQRKIAEANKTAAIKTNDVQMKASTEKMEARTAATVDKLDAQYKVEKEKCDTFAGDAKDTCLQQAKVRFGK